MADITRRTELGPTMKFNTGGADMARIAQEDCYVEDAAGIRRKIVAGAPLPVGVEIDVKHDVVATKDGAAVAVDEEASLSQAERQKAARKATARDRPASGGS